MEIWVKFRFFLTFRIVSELKLEKDGRRASMEDVRARIVKEWRCRSRCRSRALVHGGWK